MVTPQRHEAHLDFTMRRHCFLLIDLTAVLSVEAKHFLLKTITMWRDREGRSIKTPTDIL